MDVILEEKMKKIFRGELKYSSSNLAFNMLISKMQKRVAANPESLDACIKDLEAFMAKYPIVAKVDLANIAAL